MTTILAHRDTLYADSRCTVDNASFRMQKLWAGGISSYPWIMGCAGESFARDEFARQLFAQDRAGWCVVPYGMRVPDGMKIKDEDFSALLVTKDGIFHFDHKFAGDKIDGLSFAIGAGQEAVLGALEAQKLMPGIGVNPINAMMAALRVDVRHSGGPIQWMKFGEFELHTESV